MQEEAVGEYFDEDEPALPPMPMAAPARGPQVAPVAIQPVTPMPMPMQAPPAPLGEVRENSHSLGLSLLLPAAGLALGASYGGLFGAVAGMLYGGAATNVVRAVRAGIAGTPDDDREAVISGTYAALGAGAATYILWKTRDKESDK